MNKFTLLKFPHTVDEIITERIDSLNKLICESGDDQHVLALIEMIIAHISTNYEGVYVQRTIEELISSANWWRECLEPGISLITYQQEE